MSNNSPGKSQYVTVSNNSPGKSQYVTVSNNSPGKSQYVTVSNNSPGKYQHAKVLNNSPAGSKYKRRYLITDQVDSGQHANSVYLTTHQQEAGECT